MSLMNSSDANDPQGSKAEPYKVAVVLRSYNDAHLLPRVLAALDSQRGVEMKLFVFESASTDGSKEIIEAHGYDRIEHLAPGTYHSSTVLNKGVSWADTEFVAFVNSDAVLLSDDVLLKLARALSENPRCGGVFARQLPRENASVMTRLDYYVAFDHREQLGENFDYLSLVTSMIRRSCWQENPFDPKLTYAEDYVWSERAKAAGWTLKYVRDAEVEHSHDYSPEEMYRRSYGDAAAVAIVSAKAPPTDPVRGVLFPYAKRMIRDLARLQKLGELSSFYQLPRYRFAAQLGSYRGAKDAWLRAQKDPTGNQPTIPRR